MWLKQLSTILTISDKMAIKNLVPQEQDKVPLVQLRWLQYLRNNDSTVRHALGITGQTSWDDQIKWYRGFIFDRTSALYMIHYGSNIVGYVNFTDLDIVNRRVEVGIKLADNYRGKGIGRQSFEFWCDMLMKFYELKKIYLWVRDHNEVAIGLYSSMGFKTYGSHPSHFLQDGEWVDYALMVLFPENFTPSTIVESSE